MTIASSNTSLAAQQPPCDEFDCGPAVTVGAEGEVIRGQMTILIPGKGRLSGREGGGLSCNGCEWIVQTAGEVATEERVPAARLDFPCFGAYRRVFFVPDAGAAPEDRGGFCLQDGEEIATEADVAREARTTFVAMLPQPRPSFQPQRRVLINMPTIFAYGQPDAQQRTFAPFGIPVHVTAHAYWLWHFDNGVVQRFDAPGGPYPNKDVTYTYYTPGDRQVRVETVWVGSYSVADGPSVPITEPVRQTSDWMPLQAVESRPQLVAGD